MVSPGHFHWTPTADWYQGPGVYGGLTLAAITRAVSSVSPHPIRRLSVELCAPILDALTEIMVQSKRRGRKTEFLSAELRQGDVCVALAHATCGAGRTTELDRVPVRSLPKRSENILGSHLPMPPFARFFDYEPTRGPLPMGGASDEILKSGGWIGPHFSTPRDHALVAGIMDAWWPAILGASRGPRPMGTMSFAMDFLSPPTSAPGPFYLEVTTAHVIDGYALEVDKLWDHTGRLVAQAQQNIAIIR